LKRVIDTYLGDEISEMIISGEVKNGQNIQVGLEGEKLVFEAL
jgi:ATP-dependent Clp protease ATP-binding subunit ClpA